MQDIRLKLKMYYNRLGLRSEILVQTFSEPFTALVGPYQADPKQGRADPIGCLRLAVARLRYPDPMEYHG